jgi:hypothetical protein
MPDDRHSQDLGYGDCRARGHRARRSASPEYEARLDVPELRHRRLQHDQQKALRGALGACPRPSSSITARQFRLVDRVDGGAMAVRADREVRPHPGHPAVHVRALAIRLGHYPTSLYACVSRSREHPGRQSGEKLRIPHCEYPRKGVAHAFLSAVAASGLAAASSCGVPRNHYARRSRPVHATRVYPADPPFGRARFGPVPGLGVPEQPGLPSATVAAQGAWLVVGDGSAGGNGEGSGLGQEGGRGRS